MTSGSSRPVIRTEEIRTVTGLRFGIATLDTEVTLNALSLEMVTQLLDQFKKWATDNDVVGVVLQGTGTKAFCAGGDIRALYRSIVESGHGENPYAQQFFQREYKLDYLIHTYPKPVLCWGHGFVMGGGIGLMAGASHRVVTETSRLAMPEITVGLYPDVGGSWFLNKMPGKVGLFLALTGASLNAADALFVGLADFAIAHSRKDDVLAEIQSTEWTTDGGENAGRLSNLLADHAAKEVVSAALAENSVARANYGKVNIIIGRGDSLLEMANRLRTLSTDDEWMSTAAATFNKGSPTSAALSLELQHRAKDASLADVFRFEYNVSLGCCAHPDFVEGVRALMIDKDRNPKWTPARIEDITPEWIEEHFVDRYTGSHPLAMLG